jgi:hypothetical protein
LKNNKKYYAGFKPACGSLYGLVPSRWPVLGEALLTVDRTALCRLEGDFRLLAAVRAYYLVHLAWSTVEAAPFSITHFIHSFFV